MFVVLLFVALTVLGAPQKDQVTSLPGLAAQLPSLHYSGYLTALNGSHLHYYLVQAIEVAPATAPLVLWMNGGPGCSSMDGWGYEQGPVHFKDFNSSGPELALNPHTWARIANLVFLEAPPGVGFSYRDDGNYTISDSGNARNNLAAVLDLLTNKFPEYAKNSFYVAGESYAGIYVPTLVDQILLHNANPPNGTINIPLVAMIVGNGVTDYVADDIPTNNFVPFAYGHGLISKGDYDKTMTDCIANMSSDACNRDLEWLSLITYYNNIYGVYYKCFTAPSIRWKYIPNLRRRLEFMAKQRGVSVDEVLRVPPSPPGGGVPCIDSKLMTEYLNRLDVKTALHVEPSLTFHLCYDINYISDVMSVVYVYKKMIAAKLRTMFYNGNIDLAVPYTGTEYWIRAANFTPSSEFVPWTFADDNYQFGPQLGGYSTSYEDKLFWFVRVNGAGHMVPQFRPAAAFEMFSRFLNGQNF